MGFQQEVSGVPLSCEVWLPLGVKLSHTISFLLTAACRCWTYEVKLQVSVQGEVTTTELYLMREGERAIKAGLYEMKDLGRGAGGNRPGQR